MFDGLAIEDLGKPVEDWMQNERSNLYSAMSESSKWGVAKAHVFNDKYSPPADLRAEIFDEQFTTTSQARIAETNSVVQGFPLTL